MADQTVRTIYEAVVSGAQANLNRLAQTTEKAADSADDLTKNLSAAGRVRVAPKIDIAIAAAEKNVQKLTRELKQLTDADADVQVQADIDQARADLDQAESRLRALQGAKAEMIVTVDADSVGDAFDGVADAAEDEGASAGEKAGNALIDGFNSTPIVGAVVGVLGAAGVAGAAALWAGLEVERTEDLFGARTGLDEATARKYGQAAGRSYADAWGESVSDNLDAAMIARTNGLVFDTDTQARISDVNSMLLATSEILGSDIPETAEAAGTMIKNGLAGDAEEAFDIIITGYQQGADRSGDMLDTLREYSPMFASLGLDGQEAMGLISQSMEAGARNSDLAADALKEFSIRAQDDSKATRQAFTDLGLDADEMGRMIASGGEDAQKGLGLVLDGLMKIEDPIARNAAGVALFGTQWEDLGNGAQVLAFDLDNLGDAWVNTGDTAEDAMARMSDNAATKLEEARRTIGQAMTEFGGALAEAFGDDIGQLADWVSQNRGTILEFLQTIGNGFFDLAGAAVEFGATTIEVMGNAAGAISEIVGGIGDAVEAFGHLTGDQDMVAFGKDIQTAGDNMQTFADNSGTMADTLRTEVGGAIDDTQAKFNDFMDPAIAQANVDDAIAKITGRLDEFTAWASEQGVDLKINGETMDAETAFNELLTKIDEGQGTVIINGEKVPAEEALDTLMQQIEDTDGVVTLEADPQPVIDAILAVAETAATATVPVDADTTPAEGSVEDFRGVTASATAYMPVDADTAYAEDQVRIFQETVNAAGGTVTINGETVDADQALDILLTEINNGEGTVMINGTPVNAEGALLQLIDMINGSDGTVTIDGDNVPANLKTDQAVGHANSSTGTIDVDANTGAAESGINHTARDRDADIDADAHTGGAESDLNSTARDRDADIVAEAHTGDAAAELGRVARTRYATIVVRTVGAAAVSAIRAGLGRAHGGMIEPGLATGGTVGAGYGMVPAPRAPYGVDNVLWPLARGGQTLSQPLAGGEFVVNPVSTAAWQPFLEAINSGMTPADLAGAMSAQTLTAAVDSGAMSAAIAAGVQQVMNSTQFVTVIDDRVAASLVRRGGRAGGR